MLLLILSTLISLSPAKEFKPKDYCYLTKGIDFASVAETIKCLKAGKSKLFVFSNGGIVPAGDILLEYVNRKSVTVLCLKCYSMAGFLWINAKNKELAEDASMMFHYAYVRSPADMILDINFCRTLANDLEILSESYLSNLSAYQRKFFIKMMREGDFFFEQDVLDALQIKYTLINRPKPVE